MKKIIKKIKISFLVSVAFILGVISPVLAISTNPPGNNGVPIESTLAVANVTAGDNQYHDSVTAKVDDVVKVEVWYHNPEEENSGKIAKNLVVKINLPNTSSKSHQITSSVSGDNTNTETGLATVSTSVNTKLAFIPGSTYRRHNTGNSTNPTWVTEKIPDVVTTTGYTIPNFEPCWSKQETITVLARVTASAVSITKEVKIEGQNTWQTSITANPGDRLAYIISWQNQGNTTLNNLVVRDSLPAAFRYVSGSTKLYNSAHPNGITVADNLTNGGLNVGNYAPGSNGHVRFNVTVPSDIKTGCNTYVNVGVVKADGLGEYYNTAKVLVCRQATTTTSTTPPNIGGGNFSLPVTGPAEGILGSIGGISLAGISLYYNKARKLLRSSKYKLFK